MYINFVFWFEYPFILLHQLLLVPYSAAHNDVPISASVYVAMYVSSMYFAVSLGNFTKYWSFTTGAL